MPYEEESVVAEWMDRLKDLNVRAKKMFGCYCLYCDGQAVGWIHDSVLSLREVGLTFLPADIKRPRPEDKVQELVIPFDYINAEWLPKAVQDTADIRKEQTNRDLSRRKSMKRKAIQVSISEYPEALWEFIKDAPVYDSSCSKEAQVLFIDREEGFFLKRALNGTLKTESLMTEYMHSLGLSAEVLYYGSSESNDFLLTRRIPGEDCTDHRYLSEPERLCDTTATLLRSLHETEASGCPVRDRTQTYTNAVMKGFDSSNYEPDLFQGIWEFKSFNDARRIAEEGLSLLKTDVLLHGDYCLPNILLNDWKLSGYIDLGNGGMGDRHIDILWGIWTLRFNLGTNKYTDRFMDAYGRELIEPEMLRMVAAMEMIGA